MNKTMTAQMQSIHNTTAQPHRYSHLPIPTEEEMAKIIDLIMENQNNPQTLAKMEEATPPHIMEALIAFAKNRANEAEAFAQQVLDLEESINKRISQERF